MGKGCVYEYKGIVRTLAHLLDFVLRRIFAHFEKSIVVRYWFSLFRRMLLPGFICAHELQAEGRSTACWRTRFSPRTRKPLSCVSIIFPSGWLRRQSRDEHLSKQLRRVNTIRIFLLLHFLSLSKIIKKIFKELPLRNDARVSILVPESRNR